MYTLGFVITNKLLLSRRQRHRIVFDVERIYKAKILMHWKSIQLAELSQI